jgi:hypothetical protein
MAGASLKELANRFSKLFQTSVHTISLVIQYRLATTEGHLYEDCDEQSGIKGSFCKCILVTSSNQHFINPPFISISTSETFNRLEQPVYYYNFIPTLKFLF